METEYNKSTSIILSSTSILRILPTGIAVTFFTLYVLLSITAFLGNALILVVLHKVSSIHPPTKLLFRCLAVTDLCVGLISQPLGAIAFYLPSITEINSSIILYVFYVHSASNFVLCGVSILVSSAVSVDRLLALLLGLRYRLIVTFRRVRAVICCFWFIGVSNGLVYIFLSPVICLVLAFVIEVFSIIISIISYTKIFITLRQHETQVNDHVQQAQPSRGLPLNVARYKKTVSSIVWVQLALVACYAPFGIVIIAWVQMSGVSSLAWLSAITLVFLNSSPNTFLYCWKIREVRQAVKDTIRQFCCY